jgi:hypothetical protein
VIGDVIPLSVVTVRLKLIEHPPVQVSYSHQIVHLQAAVQYLFLLLKSHWWEFMRSASFHAAKSHLKHFYKVGIF